jgi:hypothetical protein
MCYSLRNIELRILLYFEIVVKILDSPKTHFNRYSMIRTIYSGIQNSSQILGTSSRCLGKSVICISSEENIY